MGGNQEPLNSLPNAGSKDLVTIFTGQAAEACVLRGILDGQGYFTHLAGETVKTMHPFITGSGMFDLDLQVSRDKAEEAERRINELTSAKEDRANSTADPMNGLESFGRRLRWASCLVAITLTNPILAVFTFSVYFALLGKYLSRARKTSFKPLGHVLTIGSGCLVFLYSLLLVYFWNEWWLGIW